MPTLRDERVVVYRLSNGSLGAAGISATPEGSLLAWVTVENDEIICKYHGLRYDRNGRCTYIPTHPNGNISPKLRLDVLAATERYGLVWVRLVDDDPRPLRVMDKVGLVRLPEGTP